MFSNVKGNFGFGTMRLPVVDEQIDLTQFEKMVDHFMAAGFNYFDTAVIYHNGESETALRQCLTSRYPRESYVLTDKLSEPKFSGREGIRPLFQRQLDACGVTYFDFYLMHAMNYRRFERLQACHAMEEVEALKGEGKIRHIGMSFHDTAENLDKILAQWPQVEVVQLQVNYLDMDSPSVQSRACLEVCKKYNKPVLVMEPVKGGRLANMPQSAVALLEALRGGSPASYAVRFAAGQEGVVMVLSGMSNLDMVVDNCAYMQRFQPLNQLEKETVEKVKKILMEQSLVDCTGCRYCMDVCPQGVPIPELFACLNHRRRQDWSPDGYRELVERTGVKADSCLGCGACESACPQFLPIRKLLKEVTWEFG